MGDAVIDRGGFRLGVGAILINKTGHVLWAKRAGYNAWQFPQGGLLPGESPRQAILREVHEELGLEVDDFVVLGCTEQWLRYWLPKPLIRRRSLPLCIGQKQKWYLLQLVGSEQKMRLDLTDTPEFDSWRWVDYWYPLNQVIRFKREVYWRALRELELLR